MELKYVNDRVINENGDVAVARVKHVQKVIRVHGRDYAFVVQRNICLSWVKPMDVDAVLAITEDCCGGNHRSPGYRIENGGNVRRWAGISER